MKKLKAKIPASDAERTLIRLMRVGDKLWRDSDERFSRWQLMDNHYNVLRILNGASEPLSQAEIGRRMLSTRANVTKLIDLLEQRHLVKRLACGDRRKKLIDITDKGSKFLQDTAAEVLGFAEAVLKPLSKTEQKALAEMLGKLLHE
ncbi:MAG: MarR family transcriptional regulator [Acidobacteria bacterium]|nr:MarR family transcriptional regulator [Acidobacteriota bacterium]